MTPVWLVSAQNDEHKMAERALIIQGHHDIVTPVTDEKGPDVLYSVKVLADRSNTESNCVYCHGVTEEQLKYRFDDEGISSSTPHESSTTSQEQELKFLYNDCNGLYRIANGINNDDKPTALSTCSHCMSGLIRIPTLACDVDKMKGKLPHIMIS
jgi:hypothetical protein